MKKWRIIRTITTVLLILFILYLLLDMINCMNMTYPHPMLGIDALNWIDQFLVDFIFIIITLAIPLIIDITLLVISIIKIHNSKEKKN